MSLTYKQCTARIANLPFAKDVSDLFAGRRAGHMSTWLYAEALYKGDKASGSDSWAKAIEQAKKDGIYYVFKKEREIIQCFAREAGRYFSKGSCLIDLGPGSIDAVEGKILPILQAVHERIKEYVPIDICKQNLQDAQSFLQKEMPFVKSRSICGDFIEDNFAYGGYKHTELAVLFGLTLFNMLIDPRVRNLPEHYLHFALLRLKTHFSNNDGYLIITQDTNQDISSLKPAYMALEEHYKSLLYRIERDLDVAGDYSPENFVMDVEYFAETQACALSFVAKNSMKFWLDGEKLEIEAGDRFYFHNAYKFGVDEFTVIAKRAGFEMVESRTNPENPCVLNVLKLASSN